MGYQVVVTGATGGIGSAIVELLARRGDHVVAVARPTARLDGLVGRLPAVTAGPYDLTHPSDVPAWATALDTVDVLIHAAGVSEVASIEDTPEAVWRQTMAANVIGPAELTRLLLPALRAARGRVVFINAAAGLRAVPRWAAYVASKSALRDVADSLRLEEAAHGIRVTSIYPGGVATELLHKIRTDLGRPYDPVACVSPHSLAVVVASVIDAPVDMDVTEIALQPPPS
jgi:NADP-dependent 3-hydroxy acid dehydrogenase YdfG